MILWSIISLLLGRLLILFAFFAFLFRLFNFPLAEYLGIRKDIPKIKLDKVASTHAYLSGMLAGFSVTFIVLLFNYVKETQKPEKITGGFTDPLEIDSVILSLLIVFTGSIITSLIYNVVSGFPCREGKKGIVPYSPIFFRLFTYGSSIFAFAANTIFYSILLLLRTNDLYLIKPV